MITRSANGIWEVSIPAPLPYSESEQLIGYVRYVEDHLEVRVSHMKALTDRGETILPVVEDETIRRSLGRALIWHLLSSILSLSREMGHPPVSNYTPHGGTIIQPVAFNADAFSAGSGDDDDDYSEFLAVDDIGPEGEMVP